MRILVVDDDLAARTMMHMVILDKLGINADEAGDGLEGYKKFQQKKYNLLITDYHMPRMNGLDLIKKIRSDNNDTPILAHSSYPDNEQKMKDAGANDFFAKPFDVNDLVEKIKNLINPQTKEENNV